ncbi:hypothetical protein PICMEDRAFT_59752 [Pichia membranifaciens NRRL Y-2026]|uniref:Uncharacterized protein n=1 Tax=Pichia membranifaciens NRRL Y-2026 TaxID=763406 RepID=A0A1E3NFG6_9ASCO|nr:hypothetical protein PICMEDRAFT_59752 [Pichia membranifaciens NRRL Y-2026]ODQ44881.1 hypothetical protein PICMEDRAFT_59752 [Pichia membranifaciens NRRL Y-2026]
MPFHLGCSASPDACSPLLPSASASFNLPRRDLVTAKIILVPVKPADDNLYSATEAGLS